VLRLIRSVKNNFAPINQIPGAILSLIPNYWEPRDMVADKDLITLTHVCHGWRELYVSHPSLWTRLDFTNVDKTRTYIKRSRSSPLGIVLYKCKGESYLEDAFLLAIPHFRRLKSLTISGTLDPFQNLSKHFPPPVHVLRELKISLDCKPAPILDSLLFDWDLSSLRTLSLGGVITCLAWKNLWNLTTFELAWAPDNTITVTRLLNFLESALHLRDITLCHSIPTSSDAPPGRVTPLPHLRKLSVFADPVHSILLNHLSIPPGASLVLSFNFSGDKSPFSDCLPKSARNLKNIFQITTVNLRFDRVEKSVRLAGPSGELYIFGRWEGEAKMAHSVDLDRRILQSLDYFSLHLTRRLAITKYEPPTQTEINTSPPYHVFLRMKDLHTLTLTRCNNLPFILALNPNHNPSKFIPCPNLEELVLYVESRNAFNIPELVCMAKERALRGSKLRSITIVGLGELMPGKEVLRLREHVAQVEYRFEGESPAWDDIAS
jgi:hypothetical protein